MILVDPLITSQKQSLILVIKGLTTKSIIFLGNLFMLFFVNQLFNYYISIYNFSPTILLILPIIFLKFTNLVNTNVYPCCFTK